MLIGSGAWVLGVLVATGGSLYVSHQLGQGIFSTGSVLTSGQVQTGLASESAESASPSGSTSSSTSPSSSSPASHSSSSSRTGSGSRSSSGSPSGSGSPGGGNKPTAKPSSTPNPPPGQLFQSSYGSVYAVCEAGGAYLEYWTAQDGYDADHVNQGPASVASVTFRVIQGESGVVMEVSCQGGQPQLTTVPMSQGHGGGD